MGLDPSTLSRLLSYDALAGTFTWRERTPDMFVAVGGRSAEGCCANWNARRAGKPALTSRTNQGYPAGGILGIDVLAHRVAWAMAHGKWPDGQIDHINHDRADNRLCNLREVTRSENQRNQKRSKANKTGNAGVYRHAKGGFVAEIRADGKKHYLGYFAAMDDAVSARKQAQETFGFHANHGLELKGAA